MANFGGCAACGHGASAHYLMEGKHPKEVCVIAGCYCPHFTTEGGGTIDPSASTPGPIVQVEPTTVISMEKPIILRRTEPVEPGILAEISDEIRSRTTYPIIVLDSTWEVIQ